MLAGATVDLNGPALLFTAAVVGLSAFVFGLVPALHSTKADVQSELKDGGRNTSAGTSQSRWRAFSLIAEVSLALVLLVGAGLMMKSLFRLLSVDAGIRPERVLTMESSLRTAQYDKDPAILNFWDRVLGSVRELPGVQVGSIGNRSAADRRPLARLTSRLRGWSSQSPGSYPASRRSHCQSSLRQRAWYSAVAWPGIHRSGQ